MHVTLFSGASAFMLVSMVSSAVAAVLARDGMEGKRDIQYCTVDDYLGAISSYVPGQADYTSFCSRLIHITDSTTTVATTTPVT